MNRVIRRPAADRDLIAIYRYYARKGGQRVADRFFAKAEATFGRLAAMPGTGALYTSDEPLFGDLRYSPISRHRSHLVFYRAIPGGTEVYRVLHAKRDIPGILAEDFGVRDTEEDVDP